MSFFGSSAARSSSFAAISLALSSRTSDPSQMMRSFSSRSKTPGLGVASAMCRSVSVVAFTRIYPVQHTRTGLFALGGGAELPGVCGERHAVPRQVRGERRQRLGCRAAGVARSTSASARNATTASRSSPASGSIASRSCDGLERAPEVADRGRELDVRLHALRAVEAARERLAVQRLGLGLEAGRVAGAGPLEQRDRVAGRRSPASASMRRITSASPRSSAAAHTASTRSCQSLMVCLRVRRAGPDELARPRS